MDTWKLEGILACCLVVVAVGLLVVIVKFY
jgi:hypothetical protein